MHPDLYSAGLREQGRVAPSEQRRRSKLPESLLLLSLLLLRLTTAAGRLGSKCSLSLLASLAPAHAPAALAGGREDGFGARASLTHTRVCVSE